MRSRRSWKSRGRGCVDAGRVVNTRGRTVSLPRRERAVRSRFYNTKCWKSPDSGPMCPLSPGKNRPGQSRIRCAGPIPAPAARCGHHVEQITYRDNPHLFASARLGYRKVRALEHQNRGTTQSSSPPHRVGLQGRGHHCRPRARDVLPRRGKALGGSDAAKTRGPRRTPPPGRP